MDRRAFLAGTGAVLLAMPLAAEAQQSGRIYRVGILGDKAADPVEARLWQTFRSGLQERGWIEGRNILFEYRWVGGDAARLPELAADLARLKPDLIVTRGSLFTGALKAATASIPIVFTIHADPEATGHVVSLAHPGENITGLASLQSELGPKGLELLSSVVPKARRIGVLWHPGTPSVRPGLKALEEPARRLRVQLQLFGARKGAELEGAFSAMKRDGAQAVLVLATPIFLTERQRMADLAIAHRLPSMFQGRDYVDAGGLMSYYAHYGDLWRRAAIYADKILRGAKAADLPIEQPTKFELVINLKTAKALGLTMPQSLLGRADEIIQ